MRIARTISVTFLLLSIASSSVPRAAAPQGAQEPRAWVATSNKHAQLLLDVLAKFAPEGAGQFGVSGLDTEVTRISIERIKEGREATQAALATLQALLKAEKDPPVRQDLEILVRSAQNNLRVTELSLKRQLPYANVTGLVFGGLRSLLDPQVSPERRAAAVVRYASTREGSSGFPRSPPKPCN